MKQADLTRLGEFKLIYFFLIAYRYLLDVLTCMRWSPRGDMLASASWGNTIVLLDFNTGEQIYAEEPPMGVNFHCLINKIYSDFFLDPAMSVCFVWVTIEVNNHPKRKQPPEIIWKNNHQSHFIIVFKNYLCQQLSSILRSIVKSAFFLSENKMSIEKNWEPIKPKT